MFGGRVCGMCVAFGAGIGLGLWTNYTLCALPVVGAGSNDEMLLRWSFAFGAIHGSSFICALVGREVLSRAEMAGIFLVAIGIESNPFRGPES